jgi:transposase
MSCDHSAMSGTDEGFRSITSPQSATHSLQMNTPGPPRLGRVLWILQVGVGDHAGMVGRGELTDTAWSRIEPLLPRPRQRGGRWRDHRQVINAILWKLRTGAPWRDLPDRYGPWKTAHERLRKWTADGTWEHILREVAVKDDSIPVEWVLSIDSSIVRAHQHAAGARKKGDTRPAAITSPSTARPSDVPEAGAPAKSTSPSTRPGSRSK